MRQNPSVVVDQGYLWEIRDGIKRIATDLLKLYIVLKELDHADEIDVRSRVTMKNASPQAS